MHQHYAVHLVVLYPSWCWQYEAMSLYDLSTLMQVVVDLFVQSWRALPEDHDVPKAVLYNPWQPVKPKSPRLKSQCGMLSRDAV